MSGYIRQSSAEILPGATVKAAPINAEYNALRDAFNVTSGHKHDGSTGEGAYIALISDSDNYNKVVVDSVNNRVSIYAEVGGAAVEQVRVQDGAIVPVTDDDIDLGAPGAEFKNIYIDGTANIDSLVSAAVTITGGTIDGTVIGATTPANGTFTGLTATGSVDLGSTVNIDGGTIDGTPVGDTTPSTGDFTTVTAGTVLANNITASGGQFTGNLVGAVSGNVSGTLSGNVVSLSGASTFLDVNVLGNLNMVSGTSATVTGLSTPVNATDAATKEYVDTSVSNLVDSAPGTLDTLNELAAALGDDANFANTVTTSIATKVPLDGTGTMTGSLDLGTNKILNVVDPTGSQDAATKAYADTKLALTGGTLTGSIDMSGSYKVTNLATPSANGDATNKSYVDGILGSATSAEASATAAATSETNAANSAVAAANSATNAAGSATLAANAYDDFDDRYLGAKSSAPSVDNDCDALQTGALYFNTTAGYLNVYDGASWSEIRTPVSGIAEKQTYTATEGQTNFSATYDAGYVDVYLNGVRLVFNTDFTATDGSTIVLTEAASAGDIVDIQAFGTFELANVYTKIQSDARYAQLSNNLSDLGDVATARSNLGLGTIATAASGDYLTTADASSTYLAQTTAASTFLSQTNAASTYLTQADAATTYLGIADGVSISDVVPVTGGTFTGNVNINGGYLFVNGGVYSTQTIFGDIDGVTISSGAIAINPFNANTFAVTLDQNVTSFSFTPNPSTGYNVSVVLHIFQDATGGYTIQWPNNFYWAGGNPPTLTASPNGHDTIVLTSYTSGTVWYGYVAGQAIG